jgi:hypothetical protein
VAALRLGGDAKIILGVESSGGRPVEDCRTRTATEESP